ncbi:MAG: Rho termination factor N-terminal domain-containing protein [Acidimicrobiales bacterium]
MQTGSTNRSGSGATKDELYERAKEAGIEGRSSMTKDELEAALAER